MKTIGNQRKPLKKNNILKPLETIGNNWKPLKTIEKQLKTIGNHWKPIEHPIKNH